VVTEEIMLKMADHVQETTNQENLCLAGGVALNCVGNGKILSKSKFKNIWIQPASGDAGGALGVASFIWFRYLDNPRLVDNQNDLQSGSYLGPQFSSDEITAFAKNMDIPFTKFDDNSLPKRIAELIADENVVGLFQGKMEFGPRALGARSIIADARSEKMQSILNLKIKFRESFRPFAPSVLEEKSGDFFNLKSPSPYMLLVAQVNEDKINQESKKATAQKFDKLKVKRSVVPAITHVDYSARIQTVSEETNPVYYNIIKYFDELTGCPVVINTSFNIRGEPIVCTPQDAYRCFMCTDMDYLVLGNFIFSKKEQPNRENFKKENISTILD